MSIEFFTVCAKNFLPYAIVLHENVKKYYPEANFTVYLCDRLMGFDPSSLPFNIVPVEDVEIPDLEEMITRYNITEFCTAIKPYCFLELFRKSPGSDVIYLDPDLYIIDRLKEVDRAFEAGYEAVLTPHILGPSEFSEHPDILFLQLGVYNFGFVALKHTDRVERIVRWWGRRLQTQCKIDVAKGIFVDQKWGDLFPSFIERTKILRHPGYNIAYWNLHERRIKGSNEQGWTVNGEPLRFLHFSGVKIDNSENISRHSKVHSIHNTGGYGDLLIEFRARVLGARYQEFSSLPYAFFWEVDNETNLHTPSDAASTSKDGMHKTPERYLFARQFRSLNDFALFKNTRAGDLKTQKETEYELIDYNNEVFSYDGKCIVCDTDTKFLTTFMYSVHHREDGRKIPNWREHLACQSCRHGNRVRAAMHLLLQEFAPDKTDDFYITEQTTPLFKWLSERYDNVVGSEYMGDKYKPGEAVRGFRHENLENLSFKGNSFDFILSFDVMEHVAFYKQALESVYRCLKPGGYFFFTAPANMNTLKNLKRAEIDASGNLVHFMKPEYHGNPVDPENGALSFRDFGWELIEDMKEIGFVTPSFYYYWSKQWGYLGEDQIVFVGQKPSLWAMAYEGTGF